MQEIQTVLVILLGIGFTILLIMGIIVAVILIRIMTNIRRLTQRLDETSENMTEIVKYLGKKVAPAALSALGTVIMRSAKAKIKRRRRDDREEQD